MEISGIALCLFSFSVICGVLSILAAFAARRNRTARVKRIQRVLYAVFMKTNLPFGILAVFFNAYDVFRYGELETGLLFCCAAFAASFVMERFLDPFHIPESGCAAPNNLSAVLELLNTTAEQKSMLLSAVSGCNTALLAGIKTTQNNLDEASLLLKDYVRDAKQGTAALAEKIKTCSNVFEKLADSAALADENAKALNKKLSSSSAAFVSVENQEALLNDISLNFTKMVNERSVEIYKKIQGIVDSLGIIAYKCDHFQSFPRPYKEIIDLYSVKIESVLGILERVKNNALWKKHFQAGSSCAYIEPDKAIAELTEAIQLKTGYADAYFFLGAAYQVKKNFKMALLNYEKALELNPRSDAYKNAIKKLKAKSNAGGKELKS